MVPATVSAMLVGAVVGPDKCTEVDNIDDSKTLNQDVEEKITLAKAVNSVDCEWVNVQCSNAVLASVVHWLESGKKGSIMTTLPKDTPESVCKSLCHNVNRFHLVNKLLYCDARADMQSVSVKQFFVPTSHWSEAIKGCHHDAGYQGLERTIALMKE